MYKNTFRLFIMKPRRILREYW